MAHQHRRRAEVHELDSARGADAKGRREAAASVSTDADQGADGRDDLPETAGRLAAPGRADTIAALAALTEAAEAQRNATFAVLQELRRGRKYRQENPPPAPTLRGPWHGHCEQCQAWYDDDDELTHHQFAEHNEIFRAAGELAFAPEPCLCMQCNPQAYHDWLQTPEAQTGPLPKAVRDKLRKR